MDRRFALASALILAATCARAESAPPAREVVYATTASALHRTFPDADFTTDTRTLTPAMRTRVAKAIGFRLRDSVVTVQIARTRGALSGYGTVVEEKGKYYPITFLVTTDPAFRVRSVIVLVYRERHGDAVRRDRFLKQFRGKGTTDPIAVDQDIVHVTGATMSSWAVAAGVRRAVATLSALYGPGAPAR